MRLHVFGHYAVFELFNLDFSKFRITYVSQGKSKVKRFLFMKNLRFYILKYLSIICNETTMEVIRKTS